MANFEFTKTRPTAQANWRVALLAVALSTVFFVVPSCVVFRQQDLYDDGPARVQEKNVSLEDEAKKIAEAALSNKRLRRLCLSVFFYSFGWQVPFVYLVSCVEAASRTYPLRRYALEGFDREGRRPTVQIEGVVVALDARPRRYAGEAGHDKAKAAAAVICIGIGGSIGRVAVSWRADHSGAPSTFSAMVRGAGAGTKPLRGAFEVPFLFARGACS